jgi:hypothetical protein
VRRVDDWTAEEGLEVMTYSMDELARAIGDGTFDHALHIAALVPALLRGKLTLARL